MFRLGTAQPGRKTFQRNHGETSRNTQPSSGRNDGGSLAFPIQTDSENNSLKGFEEVILKSKAKSKGWKEAICKRFAKKFYTKVTLATKNSKRKRVHELMECCETQDFPFSPHSMEDQLCWMQPVSKLQTNTCTRQSSCTPSWVGRGMKGSKAS